MVNVRECDAQKPSKGLKAAILVAVVYAYHHGSFYEHPYQIGKVTGA